MVRQYRGPRSVTENLDDDPPVEAPSDAFPKRSLDKINVNVLDKPIVVESKKIRQYKSPFVKNSKQQPLVKYRPIKPKETPLAKYRPIKPKEQPLVKLDDKNNINPIEQKTVEDKEIKHEMPSPVKKPQVKPLIISLVEDKITKQTKLMVTEKTNKKSKNSLVIENNNLRPKEWYISGNKKIKKQKICSTVDVKAKPRKNKKRILDIEDNKEDLHSKLDGIKNEYQEPETSDVGSSKNAFEIPLIKNVNHSVDGKNNKNDNQLQHHSALPFVKHNEELPSASVQSVLPMVPQNVTTAEAENTLSRTLRSSVKIDNSDSGASSTNTSPIGFVKHLMSLTESNNKNYTSDNKSSSRSVCEAPESNIVANFPALNIHHEHHVFKKKRFDYKKFGLTFHECVSHLKNHFENPLKSPFQSSCQMYLDLRQNIIKKHTNLFPVQPKPPGRFEDYLMNTREYHLGGTSNSRVIYPVVLPPSHLHVQLKSLFNEQEKDRHELRLQHIVQKEKLVLCVEQEILRVHGRAARELANQTLPFSACIFLKDEEVYSIPEYQDTNVQSHYNGKHFVSWLEALDTKWDTIKELMVLRHQNEAESLNARQKMDWKWKLMEINLCSSSSEPYFDEYHVPVVGVVNDFDLLGVSTY